MSSSSVQKGALSFGEACDRGKVREENQDSIRRASTPLGELVIVADGIGGYRGGATASRMAADTIAASIGAQPANCSPARAIAEAAAVANNSVMDAAATGDAAFRSMGSTVVLALITGGEAGVNQAPVQAWIGHIGDSRAYLGRAGHLARLTRDHSAVQELMDQGRLTPEEARHSPHASVLTRSIGHIPDVEIEMSMVDLEAGDTLLLCSDGLWGFVPELAIEQVMTDPERDVQDMASTLLNFALDAGGPDNIGIQVVRLSSVQGAAAVPPPSANQPEPTAELPLPGAPGESVAAAGALSDEKDIVTAPAPPADVTEPASAPSEETAPRRSGGWGKTLLIFILVLAGVAALAWYAGQQHWISGIHFGQ
ncbi:MAG TPA: protein phosphatase 2C domain-containing protein [Terracidiphilus sp.]|nr:protein phosphatase 2C domain-containing protein [Terracidiphilus sp.]